MRPPSGFAHALGLVACVLTMTSCSMRQPVPASGLQSTNRNVLRMPPVAGMSAWEAINEQRPEFLRGRPSTKGAATLVAPVVYLDGTQLNDASSLRDIPASWVSEVQYLDRASAWARFGRLHEGGALMVKTRQLPPG